MTSPVNYWLVLGGRLLLGGLFLYAGVTKIGQPLHFAAAIQAYELLPEFLVGLAAVVIPWTEAVAALALLAGCKPRSALLLFMLLLASFMGVIGMAMVRGLAIDCGCGLLGTRPVGWLVLAEDTLLFLTALWLYYALLSQPAPALDSEK